jgi:hypothetical protein
MSRAARVRMGIRTEALRDQGFAFDETSPFHSYLLSSVMSAKLKLEAFFVFLLAKDEHST